MNSWQRFGIVFVWAAVGSILLIQSCSADRSGKNAMKSSDRNTTAPNSSDSNGTTELPPEKRRLLGTRELRAFLERLGQVPEDADARELDLAQETSWWGKRMDPREFWSNRVQWSDSNAVYEAGAKGRMYPPIPEQFANRFPTVDDRDRIASGAIDTPGPAYRYTERESMFWSWFSSSHPIPPEELERQQAWTAWRVFSNGAGKPDMGALKMQMRDTIQLGYPTEMFDLEALRWAYINSVRKEADRTRTFSPEPGGYERVIRESGFEAAIVTGAVTSAETEALNRWKQKYVQRLTQEGADRSYIDAYKNKWNLK